MPASIPGQSIILGSKLGKISYSDSHEALMAYGKRSKFIACPRGQFITGFDLRVENNQGRGDDSSANDVRFRSSGGPIMQTHTGPPWGTWQKGQYCPKGSYVNDFRPRVEPPRGKGDDSALNGFKLTCHAPTQY